MPLRRRKRIKDALGRPIPHNFQIRFRRDVLAETLWEYGEDELAERALQLSEEELRQVQLLAVWRHCDDPDPTDGPKLTGARIMSRALIDYSERSGRDTTRKRRRTRPADEAYDGVYRASLLAGEPLPSTPAEDVPDRRS